MLDRIDSAGGGVSGGSLIGLAFVILIVAALWRIFQKAGAHGWAAIIPIYNVVVLARIVGRPGWWVLLTFIPFVNIVITLILYVDLAKSFGRSGGFGCGLVLLPFLFLPILGFGDSRYMGPWAGRSRAVGYGPYGSPPTGYPPPQPQQWGPPPPPPPGR